MDTSTIRPYAPDDDLRFLKHVAIVKATDALTAENRINPGDAELGRWKKLATPQANEFTQRLLPHSFRVCGRVAEYVSEDRLWERIEFREGGAALGAQRVRFVQDRRNAPLFHQCGYGNLDGLEHRCVDAGLSYAPCVFGNLSPVGRSPEVVADKTRLYILAKPQSNQI